MRKNLCLTSFVMLVVSLAADAQTGAQVTANESLRGIQKFAVVIERVNTPFYAVGTEPDTPAPAQVKAGVEEQLRSAGVQVTGPDDKKQRGLPPALHLSLVAQKDEKGFNYYSLRLWLTQEVILPRAVPVRVVATTWENSITASGAGTHLFERRICEQVHQFIKAYKAANSEKIAQDQAVLSLLAPEWYDGPCPLIKQ